MVPADTFWGTLHDATTSGRRSRRLWQILTGLAILIVVLALFAWQQGGDGDSGGPLNAIAAAAERTQDEPGGRATMRAVVTSPAPSESLSITGQIVFDAETDRSRMIMTMQRPESDDSEEMEVVGDGTVMYMRSDLFDSLPDGHEWMALDFSEFGLDPDTPMLASDAKGELGLLEATTGPVQKLGKEGVRGVPTTRYRGTISVSEQAERLREEGAEGLASFVEEKGGAPVQVEAWIDGDGLVRRMRLVTSEPREEGEGSVITDMRMDFFDLGTVPEIDVPEPSEAFDATDLAQDKLGL